VPSENKQTNTHVLHITRYRTMILAYALKSIAAT